MAYHLQLPHNFRIHNVFRVSLLKKRIGDSIPFSPTLPPQDCTTGAMQWTPAKVLQRGMFKVKNKAVIHWLIQWQGFPEEYATWENANDNIARFL